MRHISSLLKMNPLFTERRIRNNKHSVLEDIWELTGGKNSRTMFFIKTSKIPIEKLLQFKKEALTSDNFSRAFYGKVKFYNISLDKESKNVV